LADEAAACDVNDADTVRAVDREPALGAAGNESIAERDKADTAEPNS
jgi:hypothetical protein